MCMSVNALFVDTMLVAVSIGTGANMLGEVRILAVMVVSINLEAAVLVSFATTVLMGEVSDDTTGSGLCAGIDMKIYSDTIPALETILALESSEDLFAFAWEAYSCWLATA